MPHEVETMFYTREVPWHGLGTSVEEAPTSEKALIKAGLAWAVEQAPVHVNGLVVEGYRANVRATDRRVLGIVSEQYRVFQNREAFNFTDALLKHDVRYETAGSLYGGRRVWLLARLKQPIKLLNDETIPYLCVTNSHDGTGAIRVVLTPVRVVCQNTLNLALKAERTWSTRHIGRVGSRVDEAARTLGLTRKYLEGLQERAGVLAQVKVSDDRWSDLLHHLSPVPDLADYSRREVWKQVAARQERKRRLLDMCYRAPDLAPYAGSAWAVVNAVIDYTDHIRYAPSEANFARVLDEGRPDVDKALKFLGKI